jgi:hypothetical protein
VPEKPSLLAGWTAIALLVCATSFPAVTGAFLHDDLNMIGHPMYGDIGEAGAVFKRVSDEYIFYESDCTTPAPFGIGSTYRPVAMGSLVLVHALSGGRPLAHHLVSLLLHLATVLLLLLAAARQVRAGFGWPLIATVALFALHPAPGEAYLYINGRSDLLAGLALAGLALLLSDLERRTGLGAKGKGFALVAALFIASFGVLSKETFSVAALGMCAAWCVAPPKASHRGRENGVRGPFPSCVANTRSLWPAVAGTALGTALALAAPALALRGTGTISSVRILVEPWFIRHIPHLLALGSESLLAPSARSMRGLAWELLQPWSASQVAALAVLAGGILLLSWRGYARGAVLLATAALSILPSIYLVNFFWLGFDRYLYLPAMMVLFALLPPGEAGGKRLCKHVPRAAQYAGAVALIGSFGLTNYLTASHYRDEAAFASGMALTRPADPIPYLLLSMRVVDRQPEVARRIMSDMPPPDRSPIMVREALAIHARLGQWDEADTLVRRAFALRPGDPQARFNLMRASGYRGDFDDALDIAGQLVRLPHFCSAVRREMQTWECLPVALRRRQQRLSRDASCD